MFLLIIVFILFLLLLAYTAINTFAETYRFFISGVDNTNTETFKYVKIVAVVFNPIVFLLLFDSMKKNDCCTESAFFSPDHRLTIFFLIAGCMATYLYAEFRRRIASPILELLVNVMLMLGVILNGFIIIQGSGDVFLICLAGNIPIILLFLIVIVKNQRRLQNEYELNAVQPANILEHICIKILRLNGLIKFPLLLVLCAPLVCLVSVLLYVFGQRPDSAIRAFTDTYKHGLSQLDHMCENLECGGHYLCSVAANGHHSVVKPIRFGERNGHKIICNRQLLIANAFEELLEERWPHLHTFIRKRYDSVGNCVHKYYGLFEIKGVSDIVYFLMKPLEWFFLVIIYIVDRKPENRINLQYTKRSIREQINQKGEGNFFDHTL